MNSSQDSRSSTSHPVSSVASPTTSSRGFDAQPGASPPVSSPTIISYGAKHVKCRIDANVPLDEVIKQLASSGQLGVTEPAALFVLRDATTEELVTQDNFNAKLLSGVQLKLAASPAIEASEMIEKLSSRDERMLKMATFTLKSYLKESYFTTEFLNRGGVRELFNVIEVSSGNTLAYALTSLHTLMDLDHAWDQLDDKLVATLVNIITGQSLSNIVRPALGILRNVVATNAHAPRYQQASTSRSTQTPSQAGFLRVWPVIRHGVLLKTIVEGLNAGDKLLVQASLELINALLQPAIELGVDDFLDTMEKLNPQSAVERLAESSPSEDLVPAIIDYQSNLARLCASERRTIDVTRASQLALLDEIAQHASLTAVGVEAGDVDGSFGEAGLLALKAFVAFARRKGDLTKILADQQARPEAKRCPVLRASNEVLEAIAEHLGFITSEPPFPAALDLRLLSWQRVHALALKMFFRFWAESGVSSAEFERVAALVRSQVRVALTPKDGQPNWLEMERALMSTDYRSVRDRLNKEMETEEDLLTKAPVRTLRGRLYNEAFDFMRAQRYRCLSDGAWFLHTPSSGHSYSSTSGSRRGAGSNAPRVWRFYRLAPNHRYLHYVEAAVRSPVRGGLEDLPERIDLSLITDIVPFTPTTKGGATTTTRSSMSGGGGAAGLGQGGSFALVSGETVVAELAAPDAHVYAEWLDGLSLLKPNGHIQTKETADLVQILTEVGVKIKLLDLQGERVEIPSSVPVAGVPTSEDFFFSDAA